MRSRLLFRLLLASACAAAVAPATAPAQDPVPANPPMPGKFELLGSNALMNRGMNSAIAVLDGYAYIGSRTDGSHANAGVFVVDVRDPAKPTIVKEIGPADGEGLPTQSSRELRIIPDQKLLLVLNHACNEAIHRCAGAANAGAAPLPSNFNIFDIAGENAANPKLVATWEPSAQGPQTPHEFFIWSDPKRSGRVLMYYSDPGGSDGEIIVADLSEVRSGKVTEISKFNPEAGGRLHSMSVSADGRKLFMAALTGGYLVGDTSQIADNKPEPVIKQITPQDNAPTWEGPGAHSAVGLPGRPGRTMITDEVYGQVPGLLADHGCPWGWVRFIDDSRPAKPNVISEYRLKVNETDYCGAVSPLRNSTASFASHNPTLTEHLAILTWHGSGLQAIDTTNPAAPTGAAEYLPTPLPAVQTEDPVLSSGIDKVVMWSFPHIIDGLIYVVDLRNGLYILRYKGPYEEEVSRVKFLDGASNSGDQGRIENPKGAAGAGSGAGGAGGGGAGAGGGSQGSANPAVGGPAPCLAGTVRARGKSLSRFTLGMTTAQAKLRGGPASRSTATALRYCATGGGKIGVALRRGKVAAIGTTVRGVRVPGFRVGGKARGNGIVVRRGRGYVVIARVARRRVRSVAVASGKVSRRTAKSLLASAGV